ncbi:M14 family zinc carboxypeptidase [Paenibacillus sp. JX-17]|uniref:M14 family zinc carboxypeptidase n=1 Tax=Paenibacillus lacisoli TaxID=3064525 RepID=A0ABT9CF19_9BACL|nr:M14 family zinc carboxypeptidase [Paenibacillus sp. JX-17]MDO7907852.1 M14 family zinc carboxypeptidase [Paenibacillus sp. JX-17]
MNVYFSMTINTKFRTTTLILLIIVLALAVTVCQPPGRADAAPTSVVNTASVYSYTAMTRDIQELAARYPELVTYHSIGKTAYGREIWAVKLGYGEASVFINGSHHAREWLTSTLNMYMLEQYAAAYQENRKIGTYNVRQILNETSIWFVPMVNPDGVTLQQSGLKAFPQTAWKALVQMNGGSRSFLRWKANAQGIDPNRQYPADWAHIWNSPGSPSWMNYKGNRPLQTAENQSLVQFTYQIDPEIALSYHSAGRILFWNFHTLPQNLMRDKRLADIVSAITGYTQVKPTANPSGGGYTDWFITTFGRPAFTPEIGVKQGETSLPLSAFQAEWSRNRTLGLRIADEGYQLWLNKHRYTRGAKALSGRIQLNQPAAMYNENNFRSASGASVPAQTVQVLAQSGQWYKINTWLGAKWIYLPGKVELMQENENTPVISDTGSTK